MIMHSLNIGGVGGTLKMLALQRMCDIVSPDVVFQQETMVNGGKAKEMFSKIKKDWEYCTVD